MGDLIDPKEERPEMFEGEQFWGFDCAVVGLGFHHFADVGLAARRLGERLKAGGVLVVMDFLPHEDVHGHGNGGHGHGHGHGHEHGADAEKGGAGEKEETRVAETVVHMGFSKEEVQKLFEQAGVGLDFGYKVLGKGVVIGPEEKRMKREVFIARGTKA